MYQTRVSGTVILVLALAGGGAIHSAAETAGVAVVELFTSEGCSSCPPADELLARLTREAGSTGRPVHCLSFHVDYWDGLGWKDPYSAHSFTRRQEAYERLLGVRAPYTPQIVVNGREQLLGSDEASARAAIQRGLAEPTPVVVSLQASAKQGSVTVNWSVTGAHPGDELHVAWAQAEASSHPQRGENAARTLRHVQVVRAFRTVQLRKALAGTLTLTPPALEPGSVVAFVQDPRTGRILGAGKGDVYQ